MDKIDLKKENKTLYRPSSKRIAIVEVPDFHFIMIDGKGAPNSAGEFGEAIEALYPLSYALKFRVKKEGFESIMVLCRSRHCGGLKTCQPFRETGGRSGSGPQ